MWRSRFILKAASLFWAMGIAAKTVDNRVLPVMYFGIVIWELAYID